MTPETATPALHVYVAINAVATDLAKLGLSKGQRNKDQGFNFRGIDDLYNAIAPLLAKHKLILIPRVDQRIETQRTLKSGATMYAVALHVNYHMRSAVDGSWVDGATFGEGADMADKATNKAMSAAYKYFAIQTFAIPVVGSEDPDLDSPGDVDEAPTRSGRKATPVAEKQQKASSPGGSADSLSELQAILAGAGEKRGKRLTEIILGFYEVKSLVAIPQGKITEAIAKAAAFLGAQKKRDAENPPAPVDQKAHTGATLDDDLPV